MSPQAPWLQHPKAVDQRLFVAEGFDGAYKCKTKCGSLQILHYNPNDRLSPTSMKVVHTFGPEQEEIIVLARKDPRHAIAAYLEIAVEDLSEEALASSAGVHLGPRGGGMGHLLTRSC